MKTLTRYVLWCEDYIICHYPSEEIAKEHLEGIRKNNSVHENKVFLSTVVLVGKEEGDS